jgi:single-strand DNA-binding protein|tara:strand:+ start:1126 stop:1542 length:417 start_codon:yes stop_codon:yes gene_type:complete
MARGVNSCTFIGNLGADPESKQGGNNTVVNVSLAVNEEWGTGDDRKSKVEWVPLVVWGRLAEVMEQYCKKGSKIYVQGRWQTRDWEDNEGNKHYRTECVVREMLFLDSTPQSDNNVSPPPPAFSASESLSPAQDDLPF